MQGLAEAKPVHARWAEANADFLEFVARHPEYQSRASFASMYQAEWLRKLTLQPWPLFAEGAQRRELEAVALGVDRLMKETLGRFYLNDPADVAAFYAADNPRTEGYLIETFTPDADVVTMILEEPDGLDTAPTRGDYIETAEGLKLVEYNAGSFLGGLQMDAVGELCAATPPTARFLAERGRRASPPGIIRTFFRHVIESTARGGVWRGGDLNLAMLVRPNDPPQLALHSPAHYEPAYRRALEESGIAPSGRVLLCSVHDLVEDDGGLTVDGHRVHAVAEFHDGEEDHKLAYRAFKMGRVNLIGGPVGWLMSDKRNLALLSEHAGSDQFTEAERELIRRHIPWTRQVRRGSALRDGRRFRIPDDLPEHREGLVLKKASSIGGRHVHVGKFRTDAEWRAVIERALRDGDWVVQEYLEMLPYCFQRGADGAGLHDMVWGLFVFGDHFGGAFLRMQPAGGASGLVNTHQGAEVGVLLNLDG
jgi:hypothetical protein